MPHYSKSAAGIGANAIFDEIKMNTNKPEFSAQTDENLNWESRLEKLRQTRQINSPYTHVPLVKESAAVKTQAPRKDADAKTRERILQQYLHKWQQEHNAQVEVPSETAETDAMVILQENWLSAQAALQMSASDKHIESTRTVWLHPKHQTLEFPEPQPAGNMPPEQTGAEEDGVSDGTDIPEEKIAFKINVLNPQAIGRKEVFCVSEQELAERLIKRMRPHLTDAVNGMIRVALQKQMALLTYQLQQTLNEQAPQLVEDVLEHNVKKILSDIKYEMKYKR